MKIYCFSVRELAQNFFLSFSLLLTATLTASERAISQPAIVPFGGTVAATCTVGVPTNGVIQVSSNNRGLLTTTTPGKVNVQCNGTTLTVDIDTFRNLSEGGNIDAGSTTVKAPNNTVMNTASFPLGGTVTGTTTYIPNLGLGGDDFTVTIDMYNSSSALIQAGTYSFQVGLNFVVN